MANLTGNEHKLMQENDSIVKRKKNIINPNQKTTILIKINDVQLLKVNLIPSELY